MRTELRLTIAACVFAPLSALAFAQQAPPPQADQPPAQPIPALPGVDAAPSSSLLVTTPVTPNPRNEKNYKPHALRDASMFAITPPEPRDFVVHDLVQIIVRETSTAKSSQDLETTKESNYDGKLADFPIYGWSDFLLDNNGQLPAMGLEFTKEFTGEGDYERKDDLTARVTAEVIEVLPNGNLVLEARTYIKTDKEEQVMKVTGICRPEDITPLNTVNSNQIHDLNVEKMHSGAVQDTANKGLFTRVLDAIFAF